MEFFKSHKTYDFMGRRAIFFTISALLILGSIILMFVPGPNYGTDFRGGTEVEVAFTKPVDAAQVRAALEGSGFKTPDVVQIVDEKNPNHFLIRVQDVSAISEDQKGSIEKALCHTKEGAPIDEARCPKNVRATEVKVSPGGDKVTTRYEEEPDLDAIAKQITSVTGVTMRPATATSPNPVLISPRDHRVEIQLQSKGDQLMDGLRTELGKSVGPDAVPEKPLRVEWVGPKAGKQLRDSARNAVLISVVFIMLYLAFRFDLRFAPGVVVACLHDATIVIGVFIVFHREVTLSTVAAILTIVGYSMNDTVVVYDRIRENLSKYRGKSFAQIINMSVSETLSRTLLTSGATMLSMLAFLYFGTGVIKDFALAMVVGIVVGTYSSIYVAAPLTEWIDAQLAKRSGQRSMAGPTKAAKA
jgi:preprotein translocase subunit SecF